MSLMYIAISNLRRKKGKVLFLLLGIVCAVATVVLLVSLSVTMEKEIQGFMTKQGATVIIEPKSEKLHFSYGGMSVGSTVDYNAKELPRDTENKLSKVQNIDVVSAKLLSLDQINNYQVLVVGVDYNQEKELKNYWDLIGSYPKSPEQIIIGAKVAEKLKLNVGSEIEVLNETKTVTGIIEETGKDEDGLIFIDLRTMQNAMKAQGKMSFVEAKVFITHRPSQTEMENLLLEIETLLPMAKVNLLSNVMEERKEMIGQFGYFTLVISIIIVLVALLIIITFVSGSITERVREIGIFRAIGYRKVHIVKIILLEISIITFIGGIVGYIIGIGLASQVGPGLLNLNTTVGLQPMLGVGAVLCTVIIGLAASYFPAKGAMRVNPVEALRQL